MKTLLPFIVTVAVGCASHAQPKFAQPLPPPPPPEDVFIAAQAPSAKPAPSVKPAPPTTLALPGVHADAVRAHADAARAHADVAWNMPFKLGSSSSSRRTLVIPRGEANPESLANAEEDLNVMSVILEKAVEMRSDDEGKKAMGIDIFSSSSGIKNLLIEGHGAIFTLKTKIALLPPPAPKKEEVKEKETTSTEWDEARRALYGPSEIEKEIHKAWGKVHTSFSSSEEYDEKKLQRLKDSLVEALKSASNIRALSGDQTVTVVVLSSSPVGEVRKMVAEAGRGGGWSGGSSTSSTSTSSSSSDRRRVEVYAKADRERERSEIRSGPRLMLQAKKSDIDSYAKGKLNTEAFREKVKIQIY
jgi:hypothetical protein